MVEVLHGSNFVKSSVVKKPCFCGQTKKDFRGKKNSSFRYAVKLLSDPLAVLLFVVLSDPHLQSMALRVTWNRRGKLDFLW
jgi:hypothetical protein